MTFKELLPLRFVLFRGKHEVLAENEKRLCNLLAEGRKYSGLLLDSDPSLGNQVAISYAAYNSQNPLVK